MHWHDRMVKPHFLGAYPKLGAALTCKRASAMGRPRGSSGKSSAWAMSGSFLIRQRHHLDYLEDAAMPLTWAGAGAEDWTVISIKQFGPPTASNVKRQSAKIQVGVLLNIWLQAKPSFVQFSLFMEKFSLPMQMARFRNAHQDSTIRHNTAQYVTGPSICAAVFLVSIRF